MHGFESSTRPDGVRGGVLSGEHVAGRWPVVRKLGIVGAGNMGFAIVRGAIQAGVIWPDEVLIADVDPDHRRRAEELGCATTDDPRDVLGCRQIMLAVKPQMFTEVAETIGQLTEPTIVISVMAGLSSPVIRAALGPNARVVRLMPNTPAQLGEGMTAYAIGEAAKPEDAELARLLFDSVGKTVEVKESQMHAVTAVSGSGPAYVYLLAESMEEAATKLGIDAPTARLLVQQTILGAARLMIESQLDPADLRQAVTSKGGTTAAALERMFGEHLPEVVINAVTAARDRGVELDVH